MRSGGIRYGYSYTMELHKDRKKEGPVYIKDAGFWIVRVFENGRNMTSTIPGKFKTEAEANKHYKKYIKKNK